MQLHFLQIEDRSDLSGNITVLVLDHLIFRIHLQRRPIDHSLFVQQV